MLTFAESRCCCSVATLCIELFITSWAAARQAPLSSSISQSLPKSMSMKSVMPSNCHIFSFCLQSFSENRSPGLKQTSCRAAFPSGGSREESIFLPFPRSRGCVPQSVAAFFHLQSQHCPVKAFTSHHPSNDSPVSLFYFIYF